VDHLVRTWNVFHGNAHPPRRRSYLRVAIELSVEDGPSVVCLQELPLWSLPRLAVWTGYRSFPAVARRGMTPRRVAGWITRQWQVTLRSAITGQANAILVRQDLGARALVTVQVSRGRRERRVVQAVRVDGIGVVANAHLSQRDPQTATEELRRAVAVARSQAAAGEPIVLAGDFNIEHPEVDGFGGAIAGLDQVLVQGAPATPAVVWPEERRTRDGVVLSDHTPVEVTVR